MDFKVSSFGIMRSLTESGTLQVNETAASHAKGVKGCQSAKGAKGHHMDTKNTLQGQPAPQKWTSKAANRTVVNSKATQGRTMIPSGRNKASREDKRGLSGSPDGTPETKWKLTWTQKVSKKVPNLETLEKMKIELPLQRELNPACQRHHKNNPQLGCPLRAQKCSHKQRTWRLQDAKRAKDGAKKELVPPWRSRGSMNAPALGWAFIYRYRRLGG